MDLIKPPSRIPYEGKPIIFLAGSIEMNTASNWQLEMESRLAHKDIVILNPRRDAWDSSWEQSINNPHFVGQVEWELTGQETANIIVMYFDPTTKSPITLLELGLFSTHENLLVCCPKGFWRKGNVDIVCERYGIWLTEDFDALVSETLTRIGSIDQPILY